MVVRVEDHVAWGGRMVHLGDPVVVGHVVPVLEVDPAYVVGHVAVLAVDHEVVPEEVHWVLVEDQVAHRDPVDQGVDTDCVAKVREPDFVRVVPLDLVPVVVALDYSPGMAKSFCNAIFYFLNPQILQITLFSGKPNERKKNN